MPMHLPTVRQGLIPQHITHDPYMGGMEQYGRLALRPNLAHYGGARWAYVKSKRAECKGYDDAVKEYERKYAKHIKNGCTKGTFLGLRKKRCYATADEMIAAEKKGKAAWKECQAYEKGETKGTVQIDTSGGYTITESAAAIDPLTGLPYDSQTVDYSSEEQSEEPSNAGLYLAVGALLLATGGIVIYKRSKKKKGGRKG